MNTEGGEGQKLLSRSFVQEGRQTSVQGSSEVWVVCVNVLFGFLLGIHDFALNPIKLT